jgi:hypothetical protein
VVEADVDEVGRRLLPGGLEMDQPELGQRQIGDQDPVTRLEIMDAEKSR